MDTLYVGKDSVKCDVLSFKEANSIAGTRDSTRNTLSGCGIQIAPSSRVKCAISEHRARMVLDFLTRMDLGEMLGKGLRSSLLVRNPDRANRIGEQRK